MNLRRLSAAAVLAAALTLSACSAEPTMEPSRLPMEGSTVAYLEALRALPLPVVAAQSDGDLLNAGWAVCDSIAGGTGLDAIVDAGAATALGAPGAEAILEQGVRYLCPERLSAWVIYQDARRPA